MNKFFKYGFIVAGISMAVGVIFALISTMIGGRIIASNSGWLLSRLSGLDIWDEMDDWNWSHHRGWHWGWQDGSIIPLTEEPDTELRINGEVKQTIGEPGEIPADGIRNMELTLGAGQFFIREKDVDDGIISITVQGLGSCDYNTDRDTLYVECFKGNHYIGEDLSQNQIVIEFPKGSSFDEVELVCGAGVAELDHITANELDIEAGAGGVSVNSATVTKFSANIGAGRVETSNMTAREVDLEVGMGECIYHGEILQDLDAECDLGNMEIIVSGAEEDYNYEIECSAGNIDLGGKSITGLATEKKVHNGASGTFELSCNMGNITVSFQD